MFSIQIYIYIYSKLSYIKKKKNSFEVYTFSHDDREEEVA